MAYGSVFLKRAYDGAPPWVWSVVASAYGLLQSRRKYGSHFRRWLDELHRTERTPQDVVAARQAELLRAFLVRAVREIPFWAARFRLAGLAPQDVRTAEDLRALPLLKKEQVRDRLGELWAPWVRSGGVVWFHTSGTTGKALTVPISLECFQREYAFRWLHYGWTGVQRGDRTATFAGHPVVPTGRMDPPYWVRNVAERQLLFSSQHLGAREAAAVVEALVAFRPALVHGYPSALALVAQALLDRPGSLPPPKSVYTASETLLAPQRDLIGRAFRCPVMNWYGNTEMAANIVQCPEGTMHVQPLHSVVEILRPNGRAAAPGEEGELVCTGFGNVAMPLIRYCVGDTAVAGGEPCACGRTAPTIRAVTGRVEHYVVTPSGRLVGRLDHVFKDALHVREAQLIQDRPDHLRVRIVRREGFSPADEARISAHLRERLEPRMTWTYEYVETIPRAPSGKFQFVISQVESSWARAAQAAVGTDGA